MIGKAKRMGDLYIFYDSPSSCNIFPPSVTHNVSSLDSNALLWHNRLGHIYESVNKCITTQFPFIPFNKIGACDICHFSKQKITFPS